jgi:hypothetical protein
MVPRIKFDTLTTIDDWAGALSSIIDAAVQATKDQDSEDRVALQDLLLSFIKRSPAMVETLDVIAREAIEDLAESEIAASLERISSRSAELKRATGLIAAVTAEAKKDARALQLETTLDALTKAKVAIETLHKIETTATNPDQSLLQKIKASIEAIATATKALTPQKASS